MTDADNDRATVCRIVCITTDPTTGKGFWCDTCPRKLPEKVIIDMPPQQGGA